MFISISLHRKVCNFFSIQFLTYHSAVKLSYFFMKKGNKRKPQKKKHSEFTFNLCPQLTRNSAQSDCLHQFPQVELSQMSIKVWGQLCVMTKLGHDPQRKMV